MQFRDPTIFFRQRFVFGLAISLILCTPAFAEKRIALVVGNSNYQNVARLNNPANDARLMAETLRTLGFAIVGNGAQIDLDKTAFDNAVRTFGRQLQGAHVGLFYYAGHGLQVRGANYLVPVDANPVREADLDYELEDVGLVLRQMEGAGTRLNIVFLDACRNNPFGGRGIRSSETGLAQMRAPEGTLISFATQPGSVAQDGSDGHSPFTAALARTIRKPGLGIFETLNEVGLAVKDTTGGAQQPWFSTSPIKGAFYFAPVALTPGASPSAAPAAILPPPPVAKRPQTIQPANVTPSGAQSAPTPTAPSPPPVQSSPAASLVFPRAVDPKYASETAGQARMRTCVDQYNANKAANANGGMKWIQEGGGYYFACNQKLRGW
jgi:caspase domain-containing protein